jgi:hypothetical protein
MQSPEAMVHLMIAHVSEAMLIGGDETQPRTMDANT